MRANANLFFDVSNLAIFTDKKRDSIGEFSTGIVNPISFCRDTFWIAEDGVVEIELFRKVRIGLQ